MVKKKKPQIITYLVIAVLMFVFVYPFWQTIVLSFSDKIYANAPGFKFWPKEFCLDAYKAIFADNSIFIGYANTIWRTVVGTVLTVSVTYLAAFAMRHRGIPGWSLINFLIVFTMFFGGGMVPTYLNIKELGLLNTRWVLVLPGVAGAWNFIIMRNFLSSIDKEMEEAAYIDGANTFQIMLRVILPLSKAVIAVIALWAVVGHWNAWFDSMVYANGKNLLVLQTVVRRLIDTGDELTASGNAATMADITPETVRAATVMVATVPILMGYPFVQKYLVQGTMVGAVKG